MMLKGRRKSVTTSTPWCCPSCFSMTQFISGKLTYTEEQGWIGKAIMQCTNAREFKCEARTYTWSRRP